MPEIGREHLEAVLSRIRLTVGGNSLDLDKVLRVEGESQFDDDITMAAGKTVDGVDVGAHADRHESGGDDEIDLSGLTPADHASRHQNGGADEISVAGLSGELADNQPPKAHASSHAIGGADTLDGSFSKVVWKDASEEALSDVDRTVTLSYTDLDLSAYISADAKFAIIAVTIIPVTIGTGGQCVVLVRKNGTTPDHCCRVNVDKDGCTANQYHQHQKIVGLDAGQVVEYYISIGTGWKLTTYIDVVGYIE